MPKKTKQAELKTYGFRVEYRRVFIGEIQGKNDRDAQSLAIQAADGMDNEGGGDFEVHSVDVVEKPYESE